MSRRKSTFASVIRRCLVWIDGQLASALPGYCAFCHARVAEGVPWCPDCHADMPWNDCACQRCAEPLPLSVMTQVSPLCGRCLKRSPVQAAAYVPLRYEARMVRLIQRFKFSADARAGEVLIRLLESSLDRNPGLDSTSFDAIVGVPGQRERTRERGFDHTAWLTGRLAERLDLPVIEATRVRETPTQRGLDRLARRRNVKGAFALTRQLPPAVLVVDDVMTTGATLVSLALACRHAGAARVTVLAFARTPSVRI